MDLPLNPMAAKPGLRALFSRSRLQRLASYSALQMVVQLMGFAAGIVLVRAMTQVEYGQFTTVVTLVGLGCVLLDLGLSTAVLARGGAHHADPAALAKLLGDAFGLQLRMAAWVMLPLMGYAGVLLVEQGIPAPGAAVLMALVALTALLQARCAIWLAVVRLRGELALQQRLELGVHLSRLALVLALSLVHISLYAAAFTLLLPAGVMAVVLARHSRNTLGAGQEMGHGSFVPALRSFVARQAPNSLYYCVSGLIPVWLVGWFGHAEQVAEVGALGRLALIFTVIGSVLAALVQPYFARPRKPHELVQTLGLLNLLFLGFTAVLMAGAMWLPAQLLWVLGPRYAGLQNELVWMVLSAALAAWSGAVYGMGAARGWVVPSGGVIVLGLATVTGGCLLLDLATVSGALQLQASMAAVTLVLVLAYVTARLARHVREVQTP